MTKHPSSLLSAFADWEQEICDAYIVPLLTYAVLHPWFNFSEWFIATMCIVQAEAGGHSGARIYFTSVMNGWALRPLGMELSLEDHDLHRKFSSSVPPCDDVTLTYYYLLSPQTVRDTGT